MIKVYDSSIKMLVLYIYYFWHIWHVNDTSLINICIFIYKLWSTHRI